MWGCMGRLPPAAAPTKTTHAACCSHRPARLQQELVREGGGQPPHAQRLSHLKQPVLPEDYFFSITSFIVCGTSKLHAIRCRPQRELARAGRQVDYIICSHTEPDHSGACVCTKAGTGCAYGVARAPAGCAGVWLGRGSWYLPDALPLCGIDASASSGCPAPARPAPQR